MISEVSVEEAESLLRELSAAFLANSDKSFFPPGRVVSETATHEDGPDYEARYNALIEHIPGVIFVAPLDAGKGNAYVSPQIETILGFTPDEWLGDPLRWYEQVHPEDKLRWSMEAASLFTWGKPLSSNYRVLARDGRTVWFQCDARMVHSGKNSFIHGIGFDVTALKETEESLKRAHNDLEMRVEERTQALARSNAKLTEEIAEHKQTELLLIAAKDAAEASARVKSEFMANMSHEIRTPMNGVLGLTSLVLNSELTDQQRTYILMAHSSAESLLSIINEILDFSKLESGRTELHLAAFGLRESVNGLIAQMQVSALQKGLMLSCEISKNCPDSLVGDAGRLRQVLTNLIGNAIKFTQQGSVRLEIGREMSSQEDGASRCTLRFGIADTGIGMPAATLETIFQPFVQADGSITRQYGGTGLGLSISKKLVKLMGGRIEVSSEQGIGSTFTFTSCFGVVSEQAGASVGITGISQHRLSELPENVRELKVLVAEDNVVNQMVVVGVLKKSGHSVTLAKNGREALQAFESSTFDIVLMDVQMPLMDGLSATSAIRAIEAQQHASRIPIIGLSAHALEQDRERCIEAGMDGYLSKPFKGRELISLIGGLTGKSVNS